MTQADSVHSTPRITAPKIDPTRRHLLTIAAGGVVAAAIPAAALMAAPAVDPVFALIAEKRAADEAHGDACDAMAAVEDLYGVGSDEAEAAFENGGPACHAAYAASWPLATTHSRAL